MWFPSGASSKAVFRVLAKAFAKESDIVLGRGTDGEGGLPELLAGSELESELFGPGSVSTKADVADSDVSWRGRWFPNGAPAKSVLGILPKAFATEFDTVIGHKTDGEDGDGKSSLGSTKEIAGAYGIATKVAVHQVNDQL